MSEEGGRGSPRSDPGGRRWPRRGLQLRARQRALRLRIARRSRLRAGARPGRGPLTAIDVIAGLSVALILIPQSVAYARLAGLPPHAGLYAAALPPLVAAFFASSPYLQTGPVAITALLTYGALATVAVPGSPEYVGLGALLALIVGVARAAIGLSRAGKLAYFMSEPVLRGFTLGAAVLIIASQVPGALGVDAEGGGILGEALSALVMVQRWSPHAILLFLLTLALVAGARRLHPLVPGVLLAVLLGISAVLYLGYPGPTVGPVADTWPRLGFALPWREVPRLALAGVIIALVGFAEAASIARMFAARERLHWDPDREFISQGAANLTAALSGGFPVGASFSRSNLNHLLGARTRWSGAVTGAAVLVFLPFSSAVSPLPIAVLSAVVVLAVVPLLRLEPVLVLWRLSRPQFAVAATTFALTIILAPHLENAVALGIMLAVLVHLWGELRFEVHGWTHEDTLHLRLSGVLWFGSAQVMKDALLAQVARHPEVRRLTIHMERLGRVDVTGALAFELLIEDAREAGLEPEFVNIHPRMARALHLFVQGEPPTSRVSSGGAERSRTGM